MWLRYEWSKEMSKFEAIDRQEAIEVAYNRKHIDLKIREAIKASEFTERKVHEGVTLLKEWMEGEFHESKKVRLAQLHHLDLEELVRELFVGIAYFQQEELYTSVTAQLASRLGMSDKRDAILTVAEVLAVLCITDAFDITKAGASSSLKLVSRIPLPEELVHFIENSQYLPPMIVEPLELRNNRDSGYLTHRDSLILGGKNHHDGDICLDVLNLINRVPLKLDVEFLSTVEEDPTTEYTVEWAMDKAAKKGKHITHADALEKVREATEQFWHFKAQSYRFYSLMVDHGNRFHLTHKVDKRGRIYAQGYHITTQGTPFKKAMIELAHEEVVEGVPS